MQDRHGRFVGYSGLSAVDIVRQSRAIHPDWSREFHLHYLTDEEGISPFHAECAVAEVLG